MVREAGRPQVTTGHSCASPQRLIGIGVASKLLRTCTPIGFAVLGICKQRHLENRGGQSEPDYFLSSLGTEHAAGMGA